MFSYIIWFNSLRTSVCYFLKNVLQFAYSKASKKIKVIILRQSDALFSGCIFSLLNNHKIIPSKPTEVKELDK